MTALTPQPPLPILGEEELDENIALPIQTPPLPGLGEGVGG
jgi:hypothetical protein